MLQVYKNIIYIIIFIFILVLCLLIPRFIKFLKNKNNSNAKKELETYLNIFKNNININSIKKNLNDIPLYVINLKKSKNRFKNMKSQEKKFGIKFNFIEAVDGSKLNINKGKIYYNNKIINYNHNDNITTQKELGCTLSHIKAIKTSFDNNDKYCVILEDDVSFTLASHWNITLQKIIDDAPKDWELILLIKNGSEKCINNNMEKDYINYYDYDCWGTPIYLINHNVSKNLFDNLYNETTNTLNIFKEFSKRKNTCADAFIPLLLKSYCYNESLFICINNNKEFDSTIHSNHTVDHIENSLKILKKYYNNYRLSTTKIPKILHIIIKNNITKNQKNWIKYFKEKLQWKIKIWDEKNIKKINLINNDILKYKLLYIFGGVYINDKLIFRNKNLNYKIFEQSLNFYYDGDNILNIFSCNKNNSFIKTLIEKNTQSTSEKEFVTNALKNNKKSQINFIDSIYVN